MSLHSYIVITFLYYHYIPTLSVIPPQCVTLEFVALLNIES